MSESRKAPAMETVFALVRRGSLAVGIGGVIFSSLRTQMKIKNSKPTPQANGGWAPIDPNEYTTNEPIADVISLETHRMPVDEQLHQIAE